VCLVPRGLEHSADLLAPIDDGLWAGMAVRTPRTVADVDAGSHAALADPARYAFTVIGAAGEARGTTSLHDVDLTQGRREIGHTSYGRPW